MTVNSPFWRRVISLMAQAPLTALRGLGRMSRRTGVQHFTLPLAFLLIVREYHWVADGLGLTGDGFLVFVLFLWACLILSLVMLALGFFKAWQLGRQAR